LPEALLKDKVLKCQGNVGSRVEGIHFERFFVLKEGLDGSFLKLKVS
jgi:hypothetical protein